MKQAARAAWELEDGQTMVEYTAILGVITLTIVVAMTMVSGVAQ